MLYQGKGEKSTAEKSYSIYIRMISLKDIMLWFSLQIRCRSGICPFLKKKILYIFIFRVPASLHTACAERSLLTGLLPNSFLLSLYVFCGPCSLGKSLGTSHYSTPGFQPCYGTIFFFFSSRKVISPCSVITV